MNPLRKKQSQVTLFIILGIIVLFLISFTFFFVETTLTPDQVQEHHQQAAMMTDYITHCYEEVLKEGVDIYGFNTVFLVNHLRYEGKACLNFSVVPGITVQTTSEEPIFSVSETQGLLGIEVIYPVEFKTLTAQTKTQTKVTSFHIQYPLLTEKVIIPKESLELISADRKVILFVPSSTTVTTPDSHPNLRIELAPVPENDRYVFGNTVYTAHPDKTTFDPYAEIRFSYPHFGDDRERALLRIIWLDEENNIWKTIDDYDIDPENNLITARITHFTTFALTISCNDASKVFIDTRFLYIQNCEPCNCFVSVGEELRSPSQEEFDSCPVKMGVLAGVGENEGSLVWKELDEMVATRTRKESQDLRTPGGTITYNNEPSQLGCVRSDGTLGYNSPVYAGGTGELVLSLKSTEGPGCVDTVNIYRIQVDDELGSFSVNGKEATDPSLDTLSKLLKSELRAGDTVAADNTIKVNVHNTGGACSHARFYLEINSPDVQCTNGFLVRNSETTRIPCCTPADGVCSFPTYEEAATLWRTSRNLPSTPVPTTSQQQTTPITPSSPDQSVHYGSIGPPLNPSNPTRDEQGSLVVATSCFYFMEKTEDFERTTPHSGIDLASKDIMGDSLYAVADGDVVSVSRDANHASGYGMHAIIKHNFGINRNGNDQIIYSLYGHMSYVMVNQGDHITKGQIIGKVGNTGASTGPHLHMEFRQDKNMFDHSVNAMCLFPDVFSKYTYQDRSTTCPATPCDRQNGAVFKPLVSNEKPEEPSPGKCASESATIKKAREIAREEGVPEEILLGLLEIESGISHTYSNGRLKTDNLGSWGIAQINEIHADCFTPYHSRGSGMCGGPKCEGTTVKDSVDCNMEAAARLLKAEYEQYPNGGTDKCGTFHQGKPSWKAALRAYNGWGPKCNTAQHRYQDTVYTLSEKYRSCSGGP